jgi:hypothetical protein
MGHEDRPVDAKQRQASRPRQIHVIESLQEVYEWTDHVRSSVVAD